MQELIQATVSHVNAIATRSSFTAGSFFEQPGWCTSFSASAMNRFIFSRVNTAEDSDLDAVVSRADRKQLRCALRFESPLNSPPAMVR
jgi:hypothetical protein